MNQRECICGTTVEISTGGEGESCHCPDCGNVLLARATRHRPRYVPTGVKFVIGGVVFLGFAVLTRGITLSQIADQWPRLPSSLMEEGAIVCGAALLLALGLYVRSRVAHVLSVAIFLLLLEGLVQATGAAIDAAGQVGSRVLPLGFFLAGASILLFAAMIAALAIGEGRHHFWAR